MICSKHSGRSIKVLVVFLLLFFSLPASGATAEKRVYTLAVIPNLPAMALYKNWTPFVEQLSRDLGIQLELKLFDKVTTFLEVTQSGQPDFIYSAPNMFFLTYQKQKYVPLVRSSTMLHGRVFVRKDSPYTKISDLKGKSIGFVGPKNVCSVITRHSLLTGQGKIDYTTTYAGSTINVAKSVMLGKVDAGATLDISMMNDLPELVKEFRILLETEPIAAHPLAAHPRVPVKLQEAMTTAVLALDRQEQGRRILETVKLSKPVKADYKRDYSVFAQYNFDLLDKQ